MTPQTIGMWIKKKRIDKGYSQTDLVKLSNGTLKQSTISAYESDKTKNFDVSKLIIIIRLLSSMEEFPWHLVDENLDVLSNRVSVYELPVQKDCSVRLFNGKTYKLEGFLGRETTSGQIKPITEIYYQVRSVVSRGNLIAKRKSPCDELTRWTTT